MKHNYSVLSAIMNQSRNRRPFRRLLWLVMVGAGLWHPVASQAQYVYTTNNNSITITKYTGPGGTLDITNTLDGLPVTGIGNSAFYGSLLASVTVPSSITNLDIAAFYAMSSLTNITVDAQNPAYRSVAGVLFDKNETVLLQYPTDKPGSYSIPSSVSRVGTYSFIGASQLTGITIPTSVASIDSEAFQFCSLTDVTIPSSVTNIGWLAFAGANLTNLTVDPGNPVYSSLGGILCDKSQTVLIQYPTGRTGSFSIPTNFTSIGTSAFVDCRNLTGITIPSTITNIGAQAFYECYGLTNVTIPSGVTSIAAQAFEACVHLTSVTIPSSVTSIGTEAFQDCLNLTGVNFQGNAPSGGSNPSIFASDSTVVLYYLPGATGFSTSFGGRIPVVWTGTPYAVMNLTAHPVNAGTVSGNGTYPVGTNVQIVAVPKSWWRFASWSDGNLQNPRTVTVAASNNTYTANFVPQTVVITGQASPSNGGTVQGSGTYPVGTNVQLSATAANGWTFTGWSDGNRLNPRTIAVLPGGAIATANFMNATGGRIATPQYSGSNGLYDLTTVFTNLSADFSSGSGTTATVSEAVSVIQSSTGVLAGGGAGTTTVAVVTAGGGFGFPATYTVKGAVKTAGTNVLISIAFAGKGNAVLDGVAYKFNETLTYLITLNPMANTGVGRVTGAAAAIGKGPRSGSSKILNPTFGPVAVPFGPVAWQLSLALTATSTKADGTASVTLANGRVFPFTVKGPIKNGITKLVLTGTGAGKGAKLSVTMEGGAITAISGSLLGQALHPSVF